MFESGVYIANGIIQYDTVDAVIQVGIENTLYLKRDIKRGGMICSSRTGGKKPISS